MAKNQFIRLTALTLAGALLGSMAVFSASGAEVKTEEAVGYYETYGSQTMLESAGISYASYIKWLEDHDDLSDDPLYYLGTPFVGYFEGTPFEGDDYRTPNGESYAYGMEPPSYAPYNGHGMQCTGFIWNVLTNAGKQCDAPQEKLDALPALSNNKNYWYDNDIYRLVFYGEDCIEQALEAGVLEKGDILCIDGSDDWHEGIFYGETPTDNRFWHSGAQDGIESVNRISPIMGCGTLSGMTVLKMSHPDRPEMIARLAIKTMPAEPSVYGNENYSLLGTKFGIFTDFAEANAAAKNRYSKPAWSKSIGTIALDESGFGMLRTGEVPSYSELVSSGSSHEYYSRPAANVDIHKEYYAVQLGAGTNYIPDNIVYPLGDARLSESPYWQANDLVRTESGLHYLVADTCNESYAAALRVQVSAEEEGAVLTGARFKVYTDDNTFCGEIITNEKGVGWLRTGEVPSEPTEEYFERSYRTLTIQNFYAVQTAAPEGYQVNKQSYPFLTTNAALTVDGAQAIVYKAMDGESALIPLVPGSSSPDEPASPDEPSTPDEPKEYFGGDVNHDGVIDIVDATLLQRVIAELDVELPDDYADETLWKKIADVDANGVINVADVTLIQYYIAEEELPPNATVGQKFTK